MAILLEKDSQAKPGIRTFHNWIRESYDFFADSRAQMWHDEEMYDGIQWSAEQVQILKDVLGMQALTINRTFPTINMLLGMQVLGQTDIVAKGRTSKDTDYGHLGSEALKFVFDQNEGIHKIQQGFKGAVIPGYAAIEVLQNPDPRKEIVKLALRNWKYLYWDRHGSPWLDVDDTRFAFLQKWVDLHELVALFPEWAEEIESYFFTSASKMMDIFPYSTVGTMWEPFTSKEEWGTASMWVDTPRKRVMPIEMWYTIRQHLTFALFPDGRAYELESMAPTEQVEVVRACQEVAMGYVPRMRVATILGDLILEDIKSPHSHDEFPFAPFVGYTDRFDRPYGVARQIRDMDIEVNKRRTTALAKLNSKTIVVEEGAVDDMATLREEAVRPDGIIVMKKGKIYGQHLKIESNKADLKDHIELLRDSEREIGEIVGANAEMMGQHTNAVSPGSISQKRQSGSTITAPLFENLKRSKKRLGYLAMSSIQSWWKQEKIVRVTDRIRGTERLVVFNQRKRDETGNVIVANSISDVKFDMVVTDDIFSDVLREKYAEILIESTKRCAPEAVPIIMDVAFEMLDLPKKEFVLMRLRQAFNLEAPPDEEMDPKEVAKQIAEAKRLKAEKQDRAMSLELEHKELDNEQLIAKIKKVMAQASVIESQKTKAGVDVERSITDADREDEKLELEKRKVNLDANKSLMDGAIKIEQIKAQGEQRRSQLAAAKSKSSPKPKPKKKGASK